MKNDGQRNVITCKRWVPVKKGFGKVFAFLSNVRVLLGKVLYLEGVAARHAGILEAFFQRVVFLDVVRLFKGHDGVDRGRPRPEQLDPLQVILVDPPVGVRTQSVAVRVQDLQGHLVVLQGRVDHAVGVQLDAGPHDFRVLFMPFQNVLSIRKRYRRSAQNEPLCGKKMTLADYLSTLR